MLIAVLGLFALLQGTVSESILAMSLYAYTVYAAAITPVVLAAFFWRRATAAGAVVCILAGTAITIVWNLEQLALQAHRATFLPEGWLGRDAIFPALLVSVGLAGGGEPAHPGAGDGEMAALRGGGRLRPGLELRQHRRERLLQGVRAPDHGLGMLRARGAPRRSPW